MNRKEELVADRVAIKLADEKAEVTINIMKRAEYNIQNLNSILSRMKWTSILNIVLIILAIIVISIGFSLGNNLIVIIIGLVLFIIFLVLNIKNSLTILRHRWKYITQGLYKVDAFEEIDSIKKKFGFLTLFLFCPVFSLIFANKAMIANEEAQKVANDFREDVQADKMNKI